MADRKTSEFDTVEASAVPDTAYVPLVDPNQAELADQNQRTLWSSLKSFFLQNVVEDTTPQLGGNLDVNGQSIVSTSGGDITLAPDGSGNVLLGNFTFDADQSVGAGQDNYVLTYDNSTGTVGLEVPQVAPYTGQGPFTIREVSQATYDGLGTPDADTIYLITS